MFFRSKPSGLSWPAWTRLYFQNFTIRVATPEIAERYAGDEPLQDAIWERVLGLRGPGREWVDLGVFGSNQVAQLCDSPAVGSAYLDFLTSGEKMGDLIYYRLEECVRPRQLLGWELTSGEAQLTRLRQDACRGTGMEGSWMTHENCCSCAAKHRIRSCYMHLSEVRLALAGSFCP